MPGRPVRRTGRIWRIFGAAGGAIMTAILMTPDRAEQLIDRIDIAGDLLGKAMAREAELQSLRGLEKAEATLRIIGTPNPLTQKPHGSTSAEAVVEQDPKYFAFLKECRQSIVARFEAQANYDAAALRAQLAVKLAAAQENGS
jgi:hypothetical protein